MSYPALQCYQDDYSAPEKDRELSVRRASGSLQPSREDGDQQCFLETLDNALEALENQHTVLSEES